jgi:thiamine monophosphate kinase
MTWGLTPGVACWETPEVASDVSRGLTPVVAFGETDRRDMVRRRGAWFGSGIVLAGQIGV